MQRKKSDIVDYSLSSSVQNYNQPFNQNTDNLYHLQRNQQSFFIKYASSIIQVVNENRLEKSNQLTTEGEQKSLIYEISQVNYYQTGGLPENKQDKPVLSNNYNTLGEGFKKKTNKKHILTYNFTNITLFLNQIFKFQRTILKNVFVSLKNVPKKPKVLTNQPPKSKSSFHSDYTASTTNQENGPKKMNSLYLQLKRNEEFKQGINIIKGWIQFRLLIVKRQGFRKINSYFKCKNTQKRQSQSKIKASLQLDLYFAKDEAFSLVNQEQQSLVYTADQNFQFSEKQITISSPQRASIQQKLNLFKLNKDSKIAISRYGTPNNHQSVVEVYKLSGVQPSKLSQKTKPKVAEAKPLCLNLPKERKHLILRTNTFQLPLISQFYLKDEQIPNHNQLSLKKDIFIQSQNQASQSNHQILKQFQAYRLCFNETKALIKSKLRPTIFQDKNSKLLSSSRNAQKLQINKPLIIGTNQQRNGPHKIEDYYFPGLESKVDKLIQSKNKVKFIDNNVINQGQKASLPASLQKQSNPSSKNIRIKESLVRDFPLQNQSLVSRAEYNQTIEVKYKKIGFYLIPEQKLQNKRQKHLITFNSPQHRINTSPQNININTFGNNQIKKKSYFSPPSTWRQNFQSSKNNAQNVQQEYNQMRPIENPIRYSNKQKELQHIPNNIYQLNFPTHQPKVITNNSPNYYHKIENKIQNIKTNMQIAQPPYCRVISQNVARPGSKMTPSPNPVQLNFPIKTDNLSNRQTSGRQNSEKKVSFHSPRVIFQQEAKAQQHILSPKQIKCSQQYFVINKPEDRLIYFNNKPHNTGVNIPARPNQMIAPIVISQNLYPDSQSNRVFGSQRPHSSFKQSTERFNIFSNSPISSQIQHFQRSNNFTSRNSSQISRPKSMNQKILVTMRRQH